MQNGRREEGLEGYRNDVLAVIDNPLFMYIPRSIQQEVFRRKDLVEQALDKLDVLLREKVNPLFERDPDQDNDGVIELDDLKDRGDLEDYLNRTEDVINDALFFCIPSLYQHNGFLANTEEVEGLRSLLKQALNELPSFTSADEATVDENTTAVLTSDGHRSRRCVCDLRP